MLLNQLGCKIGKIKNSVAQVIIIPEFLRQTIFCGTLGTKVVYFAPQAILGVYRGIKVFHFAPQAKNFGVTKVVHFAPQAKFFDI